MAVNATWGGGYAAAQQQMGQMVIPPAQQAAWGQQQQQETGNVYIQGLPVEFNEQMLQDVFTPYGAISQFKILPKNDGDRQRSAALLSFVNPKIAVWAVENLNHNIPVGLYPQFPIRVRMADTAESKAQRKVVENLRSQGINIQTDANTTTPALNKTYGRAAAASMGKGGWPY